MKPNVGPRLRTRPAPLKLVLDALAEITIRPSILVEEPPTNVRYLLIEQRPRIVAKTLKEVSVEVTENAFMALTPVVTTGMLD